MSTYYHCAGDVHMRDLPSHISFGAKLRDDTDTFRIYPDEAEHAGISYIAATDGDNWAWMDVHKGLITGFTRYGGNTVGFLCELVPSIDEHTWNDFIYEYEYDHDGYDSCGDEDCESCMDALRDEATEHIMNNFSDFV